MASLPWGNSKVVGAGHHSGMAGAKAGVSGWQVVSWFAVVSCAKTYVFLVLCTPCNEKEAKGIQTPERCKSNFQ